MTQQNKTPPVDRLAEPLVMRESLRARTTVAPTSILATFSSLILFMPFLFNIGVSGGRIALWAIPIMLLMVARGVLSKRIKNSLDQYSSLQMSKADRVLRISSAMNQTMVGLSIWIVQSPLDDSYAVPLFMTLILAIWAIGVMANLFSDYRTFVLTLPLLIGPNAGFWIVEGGMGVSIGFSMLLAAVLMVLLVHRGSEIFRDSVLMRFEKDQLLQGMEIERKKTQEALLVAQSANDSKAYFVAAASHDIKQPLYALSMLTDTLLLSDLPESSKRLLNSQRDSISHISEHFDALMDMGRIEGHGFIVSLDCVPLGEFVSRFDSETASLCARKGLVWNLQVDDVLVSTDAELLLRLVRNLLSNAVHYTEEGEVSCIARAGAEHVVFEIADTGKGIPEEHQQSVFEEFIRLSNDGVISNGAGLGLSIVEKINRALSLDLTMTSVVGQGTRFNFKIPISVSK